MLFEDTFKLEVKEVWLLEKLGGKDPTKKYSDFIFSVQNLWAFLSKEERGLLMVDLQNKSGLGT